MADIRFDCPACSQPMVADDTGAGTAIACPGCAQSIQIPLTAIAVSDKPELLARIASLKDQRQKLTSGLEHAQAEITRVQSELNNATHKLSTWEKQREALATAFETAKAELSTARGQISVLQAERKRLVAGVALADDLAREKAAAKQSAEQLRLAQSQHGTLATELHRTCAELARSRQQLAGVTDERDKERNNFLKMKAAADEARAKTESVQGVLDKFQNEVKQAVSELAATSEQLHAMEADRHQLRAELEQNREALTERSAQLAAVQRKHDYLAAEFQRMNDELSKAFEPAGKSSGDQNGRAADAVDPAGRAPKVDLQCQNDFLTGIIARMNEERSRHATELKQANAQFTLLSRGVMALVLMLLLVAVYVAWVGTKSLTLL